MTFWPYVFVPSFFHLFAFLSFLLFVHYISAFRLSLFIDHLAVHENSPRHIPSHFSFPYFSFQLCPFCSSFQHSSHFCFYPNTEEIILERIIFYSHKKDLSKNYIISLKMSCREKKKNLRFSATKISVVCFVEICQHSKIFPQMTNLLMKILSKTPLSQEKDI